jgi:hypothetical protein
MLLQLLYMAALLVTQVQAIVAAAGAPGSGLPFSNGSYLQSRLMPPKPKGEC